MGGCLFHERMEVMGTQPRLEEESKTGSLRVGNKPGGKTPSEALSFNLLFGGFTTFQDLSLKTQSQPNMCL